MQILDVNETFKYLKLKSSGNAGLYRTRQVSVYQTLFIFKIKFQFYWEIIGYRFRLPENKYLHRSASYFCQSDGKG